MEIRFGACSLDTDGRRLFRDGREVHLTPKAFDLLSLLIENRHRAVAKTELLERIWPGTFITEDGLARLVNEIRNAIGDTERPARWVRTVHRFGYAFAGPEDHERDAPPPAHVLTWASREFPLLPGENVVGRDPGAAVAIDAPIVSRRHARITVSSAAVTIEDLGSKNGTFVRGARITAPVPLQDGDEVRVGDFSLVLRRAGSTPTQTLVR